MYEITIMKLILVQLFSLFIFTASAQQWIDHNAQWHYGWWTIGGVGYTQINYTGDTLINGQACQKLVPTNHSFAMTQFGTIAYVGAEQWPTKLTYSNGDTVFWLVDNDFHVLYNFGGQQGDMWDLGLDTTNASFLCSYSIAHVDSSGVTDINSSAHRWVAIRADSLASYGFNGMAIEGIGQVGDYLFPLPKNCNPNISFHPFNYHFNCFSSDSFALYNPSGEDCDHPMQVVSIEELQKASITIYPNPTNDITSIALPLNSSWTIEVYATDGNLAYTKANCTGVKMLDTSNWQVGLYLCKLTSDRGVLIEKRIVKQ